jgi:hypothetical protein
VIIILWPGDVGLPGHGIKFCLFFGFTKLYQALPGLTGREPVRSPKAERDRENIEPRTLNFEHLSISFFEDLVHTTAPYEPPKCQNILEQGNGTALLLVTCVI